MSSPAPELHLFILWQRARYQQVKILEDVRRHFAIKKQYAITWSPKYVSSNFSRFYGTNLPNHSSKERECGRGEFLLIVVEDTNPRYEVRDTSRGMETVNVNMFDAKMRYREWTGGGHKVHGTNNPKETNHDMTLLLGINVDDFSGQLGSLQDDSIEVINRDIVGAEGWNSLEQLFYVLNSTVRYVVMRGYGELSTGEFINHSDTDILTDEYDNLWWVLNTEKHYYNRTRPKADIKIKRETYLLDIWDSRRNYYDPDWLKEMLLNTRFWHGMKILSPENDFYCLLYHCLTNKGKIASDYLPKLERYKQDFGIQKDNWGEILVDFLSSHNYDIAKHTDSSNPLKLLDTRIVEYAKDRGVLITNLEVKDKTGVTYFSKVYKRSGTYIKVCTPELNENERRFLCLLEEYDYFPKVVNYEENKGLSKLEISEIAGVDFDSFFSDINHQRKNYVLSFIRESLEILRILQCHGIIHRDFIPQNLLLRDVDGQTKVGLIDFGWAISEQDLDVCARPKGLGKKYRKTDGYSDKWTFGKILEINWWHLPMSKRIRQSLLEKDEIPEIVEFSVLDSILLWVERHRRTRHLLQTFMRIGRNTYKRFRNLI